MKKIKILLFFIVFGIAGLAVNKVVSDNQKLDKRAKRSQVNWKIDNQGYWRKLIADGVVLGNPDVKVAVATYTGSKIMSPMAVTENSPDVPVTDEGSSTQSENSIFVDRNAEDIALNSNNSTSPSGPPSYGADYLYTFDFAETWDGSIHGPAGDNQGDPAACIGTDGRWYVGFIYNSGQSVSYSDDQGQSWTRVQVSPKPGNGFNDMCDKNHLWIDTKEGSPYENYLYDAWTDFGGGFDNQIVLKRSIDKGLTWDAKQNISSGVNAGSHCQGVNLATGPNGEVYAAFAVYDGGALIEKAIGFCKSTNGGESFEDAYRAIDNIHGIRAEGVPQNMRTASFPAMDVDISGGTYDGNIYIVWPNRGVPGINTGSDIDVYMIRSTDGGDTWDAPVRINQDKIGEGKTHYQPWISVDPANGVISVVFYDNRNTAANQAEAWVATSSNGGETWEDFKVSDVLFTPSPIPGMANGYFGDYLGISSYNGHVYPTWTDNRSGHAMTYVSPFITIVAAAPYALTADMSQETGICNLAWNHDQGSGFKYYKVYRDGVFLDTTLNMTFIDTLPDYAYVTYGVTAFYGEGNESVKAEVKTQYGTSQAVFTPDTIVKNLNISSVGTELMKISNEGTLYLTYSMSPFFTTGNRASHDFKDAKGGGDEYIHRVTISNLDNGSAANGYSDYSNLSALIKAGESYTISVRNGFPYPGDRCATWVDWNNNGEFDEPAVELLSDNEGRIFTGTINAPLGLDQDLIRMRVRLVGPDETLKPEGDTKYGEVEDYSFAIVSWLDVDPDNDTVQVGDSIMVVMTFDDAEMDPGTYTTDLTFKISDLGNTSKRVHVIMNVTDLEVTASASVNEACEGSEIQLFVGTTGGSGNFAYHWHSIPEGFTSTDQNPVFAADESRDYIVEVKDGMVSMFDTVTVTVFANPDVNIGEDIIICGEGSVELDAGNEGASFLWSTEETTQTVTIAEPAGSGVKTIWVQVTNDHGCVNSDTTIINFSALPVIDLGNDTAFCAQGGDEIILDAGNEGSSYDWSTGDDSQTLTINKDNFDYGVQNVSVEVTTEDGCSSTAEVSVELKDCTTIGENGANLSFDVYPNPNSGSFTIELNSNGSEMVTVKIVSVTGALVYNRVVEVNGVSKQFIDLDDYSKGVYTVSVYGDNYQINKKIVIR
jgi:hypothetical protein